MDTKFSIALHILVYIEETTNIVTSELLAKSVGTNSSHIRKIISLLKDADIITSQQGKKGIILNIKATDLTLDKVYFAVYPEKELIHIHDTSNQDCPIGANIHGVLDQKLDKIQMAMEQELGQTSLAQLVADAKAKIKS